MFWNIIVSKKKITILKSVLYQINNIELKNKTILIKEKSHIESNNTIGKRVFLSKKSLQNQFASTFVFVTLSIKRMSAQNTKRVVQNIWKDFEISKKAIKNIVLYLMIFWAELYIQLADCIEQLKRFNKQPKRYSGKCARAKK